MKLLKTIVLSATLAVFSLTLVTSPATLTHAAQAIKVTSITVKSPSKPLTPTQTFQLKPTVITSPKGNAKITYSSTNTKVATVNGSGLVTAVSPGKATIYVSSGDKKTSAAINVVTSDHKH
ncbi:Ig-like domain-containing protein [Paenibacillus sp. BR2-3]|uniref:Ig-like domain-containing protein n=1 Tax=Paenibacillus sp. BR2-3 TaxID=3048494 RepID=UPI00397783DC